MKYFIRYVSMLVLLCICGSIHAQMKVESFNIMSNDIDAKVNYPLADNQASKKNQFCAIIKVVTTEMECSFDIGSLTIAKVDKKPAMSEVWVYVPVGTKMIKITHPRHGQLDTEDGYYYLPEKCKSGSVYRLKLHTEFRPDDDIIKDENKFATVSFNVFPKDAKVILRKMPETTDNNGKLEKTMPLGTYHYRIFADNYHYHDGQFELVSEGSTQNIDVQLHQAFGWAVLPTEFDASNCQFSIEGTRYSLLQSRIAIPSGNHKLHIEKRYYYPEDIDVTIEDSVNFSIMPKLRPILGKLMVSTPEQPGATVKIDGKEFGVTPFDAAQNLIIGKHFIEISRPNYVSQTREIEIKENTTENMSIFLTSLGNFNITTTPVGASLYINNKYIGVTPCAINELASGDYNFRFEKMDYHIFKKRLHLDAANPNHSFKLSYQYQKKNQIYAQPFVQLLGYSAIGIGVGGYLKNFNLELDFLKGLKSENIYWTRNDGTNDIEENLSSLCICTKLGYGFIIGTRTRITPQVGASLLLISGEQTKCNAINIPIGARIDFALTKFMSVMIAPEYDITIAKSSVYSDITSIFPNVKDWGTGFNLRAGLSFSF